MKRFTSVFIFYLSVIIFSGSSIYSQQKSGDGMLAAKKPGSRLLLTNSHLGKDFWISLHPIWSLYDSEIRIYVYSYKKATVKLESTDGNCITRTIDPYVEYCFSSKNKDIQMIWTESMSEMATNFGYHVSSDVPIGVYVISNAPNYCGEGYQAVPVENWSKEYFNMSYYDFKYHGSTPYAGGFIVIASEDKTNVTINLKGLGYGDGKTKGGRNIGDVISNVSLNKGQTYLVCGNVAKSGFFDLSGSKITADKPIGLVSYHAFTCITSLAYDFGNYMSEMSIPTYAWGKKFATVQFTRNGKAQYGDFFRIQSCKDMANWHADYYDKSQGNKLGQLSSTLKKAGDFYQFFNDGEKNINSVRGTSFWESDKPSMVTQYSYSHWWDNDLQWQPVMIQLTSIEQYITPIIFYSPQETNSELTVFAIGEPGDPDSRILKQIMLDGEPLYLKSTQFLASNIPGTEIFWAKLDIPSGVHTLSGPAKMAGYLTRTRPGSFGWYIGGGLNKIDEPDAKPPVINLLEQSFGTFKFEATELNNSKTGEVPVQVDQGLSKIVLLEEESSNYMMEIKDPDKFIPRNKITKQQFTIAPIDKSKPATAVYGVLDRAGNYIVDSVSYTPPEITINPQDKYDFGSCRLKTFLETKIKISNCNSKSDTMPFTAKLNSNTIFSIIDCGQECCFSVPPGSSMDLALRFSPAADSYSFPDHDSLLITSPIGTTAIYLTGRGIAPRIQSTGWNFDTVEINKSKSMKEMNGNGLEIKNPGTDTLIVKAIENVLPPFYLDSPSPEIPFSIAPDKSVWFNSILFMPPTEGDFTQDIKIVSDAESGDSIITLKGKGYKKEVTAEDLRETDCKELSVMPNPAGSGDLIIKVDLVKESEVTICIYDERGRLARLLYSGSLPAGICSRKLDTKGLPSGTFYLIMKTGDSSYSKKVSIIR